MHLLIVPVLRALIGTLAAVGLGVPQDYGLIVSAVVSVVLLTVKQRGAMRRVST